MLTSKLMSRPRPTSEAVPANGVQTSPDLKRSTSARAILLGELAIVTSTRPSAVTTCQAVNSNTRPRVP
jgi:hypothetical protein